MSDDPNETPEQVMREVKALSLAAAAKLSTLEARLAQAEALLRRWLHGCDDEDERTANDTRAFLATAPPPGAAPPARERPVGDGCGEQMTGAAVGWIRWCSQDCRLAGKHLSSVQREPLYWRDRPPTQGPLPEPAIPPSPPVAKHGWVSKAWTTVAASPPVCEPCRDWCGTPELSHTEEPYGPPHWGAGTGVCWCSAECRDLGKPRHPRTGTPGPSR